jgi:hypothetical protein
MVRRQWFVLLGVLALMTAACNDSKPEAAPVTTVPTTSSTTSTTVQATTTTTLRPTTTVTTLLQMGPGDASIGGTVVGPAGPVDGATVHIERLVGKLTAATELTTTGGGSWNMPSLLGGAYRVRAFKAPDLGQSPVETFFLAANERKIVDLRLPAVGGERIAATVNPNPPRVGQPASVTIQVGVGRVDAQGKSSITPRPGLVMSLVGGPGIVVESAPQVVADANGSAAWSIRCSAEGASTVTLTVSNGVTTVQLPPCITGPPPTAAATTTTQPR